MKKTSLYGSNSPPLALAPLGLGTALHITNHAMGNNPEGLLIVKCLLQSLPNGLWLFAVLNLYRLLFKKHSFYQNLFWITSITLLAITTEYLQAFHLLRGTFDILDLFFYECASVVATYLAFEAHLENLLNGGNKKRA
jgi:hypothetical protein